MNEHKKSSKSLAHQVKAIPGGEHLQMCCSCGTCVSKCMVQQKVESSYNPRRLIRKVMMDLAQEAFEDKTTWLCSACDLCYPAQPVFITSRNEVERLIMGGFCQNNLAVYLTRRPKGESIGIICRGCESRAIRALLTEHQHSRDKLYLIGVPCKGILDWRKIENKAGDNIIAAVEEGDEVIVSTPYEEHRFNRVQMLHESCACCLHPNPQGVDIFLGETVPEGDLERTRAMVGEFEAKPPEERFAFFARESERCIRCYACREACPMCFCTRGFVDCSTPRWIESMVSPAGTQAWQIIRAFHQAGRCVSCGACERACPMDIKMIYLTEKLNDDMRKLYGFETGMSENQPPFASFCLDDKNRFLRQEEI